ncbi:MAG: phosphoglucosamine mutase [Actinomycetota bacterium]
MIEFGTDGIRGRVGDQITVEVAYAIGRAAAEVVAAGRLCVARDTRASGEELARAVHVGAVDGGSDVLHLGVVPTPVLASATVSEGIPGCMITASHNPYHDNGLKLFNAEGLKLSPEEERAVEARINELMGAGTIDASAMAAVDVAAVEAGPIDAYAAALLDAHADLDLSSLAVGFDFAHGAGSFLGPRVFDQFKAGRVHYIGADPDGTNINDGFGSTAPEALMAAVVAEGLDVAFAFDGDGDRVMAIDEDGGLVDGDELIAILADDMAARGVLADRSIVVSNWSNLGLFKAMAARDIEVVQSQVGDKYILELLNTRQLSLGGEQSGHIILREHSTTGDGMLVAAEVLSVLGRSGRSLGQLAADAMQRVPQVAVAVRVTAPPKEVVAALADELAAQQEHLGDDGRAVLRPSGTEPVVRVMAEAPTEAEATAVVASLSEAVRAYEAG